MGEKKVAREVTLSARQWCELYQLLLATVGTNAAIERRIQAAEAKVSDIAGANVSIKTGVLTFAERDPYEPVKAELTDLELFGCKVALVQAIAGDGRVHARASIGRIKRFLLPLASELGIAKLVQKESALPEDNEEKLAITFDDEPEKVDPKGLESPEGRTLA